jgi:hypothetical protein
MHSKEERRPARPLEIAIDGKNQLVKPGMVLSEAAMTTHPQGSAIAELTARLTLLERRNRLLSRWLICLCFVAVFVFLGSAAFNAAEAEPVAGPEGVVKVRELIVVDDKGVVRARVGANLPDAIINGKRMWRGGEKVSGVMLYDGSGQERGGYVTFEPSGNIGLTLDSKKHQTALFVAGPNGGSALQLFNPVDKIEMRSDSDGSRLSVIRNDQLVHQSPPIASMTAGTCSLYKEALARAPAAQVMKSCQGRFPSGVCSRCLGAS